MRKKFIAGNWKMYTTAASARELAVGSGPRPRRRDARDGRRLSAVPLSAAGGRGAARQQCRAGAQNVYPEKEGASPAK